MRRYRLTFNIEIMKLLYLLAAVVTAMIASSCNHLTPEAKEIIGDYYIDEISDDEPLLELKDDGTSVVRAIRPQVLTVSVPGEWNVERDSLIIVNDLSQLKAEGDTSIMGTVARRMAHKLIHHDDYSIVIEKKGIPYEYRRHRQAATDEE